MKLADHLGLRLTGLFVIIFLIWSIAYFFVQMHEIHDGIDEGLTNLKQEFIVQANKDPHFIEAMEKYDPINMTVKEISHELAVNIKEEHSTTEVYFDTEEEFEEVRILTTAFRCESNGKYYQIQFFTSTVESDDLIQNMFMLLAVLWFSLGILLLWTSRKIIKNSSKPFYELLENLHNFNLDRTQMIELPQTNISEFKLLNNAIESLLRENIQAYKEQKNFIENASHELQTPLAIIISKVELLMNSEKISEDQLKELSAILSNLNRMKRLNNSLLLLSKIKNRQFQTNEDVDFKVVLAEVLENFEDIIEHKQISLEVDASASPVVEMNPDLAHILISNLVKNAVNYTDPNNKIIISLAPHSLTIANDGEPLPNGMDIFERYVSHENASTGLGLAIVSSISSIYSFKIQYTYQGMHSITIFF